MGRVPFKQIGIVRVEGLVRAGPGMVAENTIQQETGSSENHAGGYRGWSVSICLWNSLSLSLISQIFLSLLDFT